MCLRTVATTTKQSSFEKCYSKLLFSKVIRRLAWLLHSLKVHGVQTLQALFFMQLNKSRLGYYRIRFIYYLCEIGGRSYSSKELHNI